MNQVTKFYSELLTSSIIIFLTAIKDEAVTSTNFNNQHLINEVQKHLVLDY